MAISCVLTCLARPPMAKVLTRKRVGVGAFSPNPNDPPTTNNHQTGGGSSYGGGGGSSYGGGGGGGGGYGGGGGGYGRDDLDNIQLSRPDFSNLSVFEKNFYFEHPAVSVSASCGGDPVGSFFPSLTMQPQPQQQQLSKPNTHTPPNTPRPPHPPHPPHTQARTPEQIEAYRVRRMIHVYGDGVPKPVETFEEASFPEYVLSEVLRAGFTEPSPIQSQVRLAAVNPVNPIKPIKPINPQPYEPSRARFGWCC